MKKRKGEWRREEAGEMEGWEEKGRAQGRSV